MYSGVQIRDEFVLTFDADSRCFDSRFCRLKCDSSQCWDDDVVGELLAFAVQPLDQLRCVLPLHFVLCDCGKSQPSQTPRCSTSLSQARTATRGRMLCVRARPDSVSRANGRMASARQWSIEEGCQFFFSFFFFFFFFLSFVSMTGHLGRIE